VLAFGWIVGYPLTASAAVPDTSINSGPPALTNSPSATFTFSSSASGVSFECSLDASAFEPCASPIVYNVLAEGSHTFEVRASNVDGIDPSPASYPWTVDLVPLAPIMMSPSSGSTTNDSTPVYSGTAEAGATVEVVVDSVSIGSVTVDASGHWTYTPTTPLADGAHSALARASDGTGNTSPDSNKNTFTVDTTAPAAPVVTNPANGSTTNDSTPTYSGTAEAGATVAVVVDSVSIGSVTADASGNWTYTPSVPLADDSHSVKSRATDAAGNTSVDSNTNTFTLDATPPAAPVVTDPANGSTTNNARPVFSGTGVPNVEITVFVDIAAIGHVNADAAGNWSFTPAGDIFDGAHTVWTQAKDAAGNWSLNSNTNAFTVDTAAPPAPVTTSPADGSATNDSTPTYSGTAEANSTVTVVVDGTPIGTTTANASGIWSLTQPTALANSSHTVRSRSTDTAGNTGPDSNTNTFTVDTTPPAAPVVTSPAQGTMTNDSTPTYTGTAETNAIVTVVVDGASFGPVTADASGNWTYTPSVPLADGAHTVKSSASDAVGNTSPDSNTNTFTVDSTAPAAPVVTSPAAGSTTNDSTPTYSGTAEANSTVNVFVDGTSIGTTPADASGNWSMTEPTSLTDGSHMVRSRATDAIGNTSPDSGSNAFTVDTTAPAAPVVTDPAEGSTTKDATPTYKGTVEANAIVTVVVDGASFGPVTADASGNWTYTSAVPLADGSHLVLARASDGAGNTSPDSNANTFTVDTTAPAAPVVTSPTDGSTTNDSTPTYSGTAESGSTVTVLVDGTSIGTTPADGAGVWTLTQATPLADGPHGVSAKAADAIGNIGPAAPIVTFAVNTSVTPPPPPSPPVYQPSPRLDQLTAKATKDGSELALTPGFNREQFAYSAETEATEAIVRAVPSIAGSSLLLDGAAWGGESVVKLNEGSNRFTIRVASAGGVQEYVLTIVRKRAVAECPFVDVEGHWSKASVCEAFARSIVNGVDTQHFMPDRPVTRAEFAAMLMNAIGQIAQQEAEPDATTAYSDDAELPDWAAQLVREGTVAGILKGYPDGSFRPGAHISRAEMALMLTRATHWQTGTEPTSFKDDAKLPYWARPAIGAASANGILLGRDSGRFDAAASATRAEAAAALLRVVQSLQK